ncbi:hypothetical protein Kfla_4489 [Kribbella flavida DSM 17836]|uniref:Uncharacterized protein n=1 Tax=Kribbella flavida (strain DSM 17836 / JCM 10339 / NBRC 14399) TaxID=479435 RepID=D2PWQ0_KRIFD|nr:hypothetical protein [Kribbella flavida]ADB33519.1 hypothetical protein Kfla_4489 [Kribbella flavida DSM 17836]
MNAELKEPNFGSMAAYSYLSGKASAIESLVGTLAELKPSSNAAADKLAAEYRRKLAAISPQVTSLAGAFGDSYNLPLAEQVRRARQVGALIATVKPTGPDLPTLIKTDPALAVAYHLAPSCTPLSPSPSTSSTAPTTPPTTPLPLAADGENYQACTDGNCEVLVKQSARFAVKGKLLTVTVTNGEVNVSNREADGSGFTTGLTEQGGSKWGSAGSMTEGKVSGRNATAAVLRFTSGP